MRQFYLHSRKSGIFYVQFVDPSTKRCLTAHSTRKTNRDEALVVVYDWIKNGTPQRQTKKSLKRVAKKSLAETLSTSEILQGLKKVELTDQDVLVIEKILQNKGLISVLVRKNSPQDELAADFCSRFWDYDKSPYIREKLSLGIGITKGYTKACHARITKYWIPYFKDIRISEITRQKIKDFSNRLVKDYPNLATGTRKQIRVSGLIAFRWAYANELIHTDPTRGLPSYSSKSKKRGILTPDEASALFRLKWSDNRCFLANLVAMVTGLRAAEIVALHMDHIGEKYLYVEFSYSKNDGLKSTKTEEPRMVPIVLQIRNALIQLGNSNPHHDGYIFYSDTCGIPMSTDKLAVGLKNMLIKLRIRGRIPPRANEATENEIKERKEIIRKLKADAKDYWTKRNVVFHSWRHFYSARMADKLDARKVMLATGHKTESVFQGYADHALENNLAEVADTTEKVFSGFIPENII
jgi:integrase